MLTFVLIVLLDFEFAGKTEIDFSMIEQKFSSLEACKKFESEYIKKYNNIKGSGCIEYKKVEATR